MTHAGQMAGSANSQHL